MFALIVWYCFRAPGLPCNRHPVEAFREQRKCAAINARLVELGATW